MGAPERAELSRAIQLWKARPSSAYAAEVVATALASDQLGKAREAAASLANLHEKGGFRLRSEVASSILEEPETVDEFTLPEWQVKIAGLKKKVRSYPANALAWVNLALAYANFGERKKAERSMRVALGLAGDNRYVLRSAARFYLHIGENERALYVLHQSAAMVMDPWLLAADLAVAGVRGRSADSVKDARNLLRSGDFSDYDCSELASQLATLEYESGRVREARRLFSVAMKSPTENSSAQFRFVASQDSAVSLPYKAAVPRRNFEATALKYFDAGQWSGALSFARRWYEDEPFARRATVLGSYIASDVTEDYEEAQKFASAGLQSNRGDPVLINNLAFALGHMNKVAEARRILSSLDGRALEPDEQIPKLATDGFLQFREGRPEQGRRLYEAAIEASEGLPRMKESALLHLALEEVRTGPSAHRDKAVDEALDVSKDSTYEDIKAMRYRLEGKLGRGASHRP